MKKIKQLGLVLFSTLLVTSCGVHVHSHPHPQKEVPPGQMKKRTGSKSAKPYAPGQTKKKHDKKHDKKHSKKHHNQ